MSLYADYLRERTPQDIIETDQGFATYEISGKECYIVDIYTKPEARKQGIAAQLADNIAVIAKERGCTILTGTVCPSAKGSTESLKVLLAYGFKLAKAEPNLIWFYKEIE